MTHLRSMMLGQFLAVLVTVPVAAQQPDSTGRDSVKVVELKPIEVVGSILGPLGPRVGSGVPARTTIINRDQIEANEPRLISDLLVTQAGISSYDDLGASYKMSLSSRGFFASPVVGLPQGISVFLDGVRQNEPDAAQVNFDLLPMEHVTRVEILSGTASLLGRNSLGGAVNLVTNSGGGPTRGELEVSGGNYKTFGSDASIAGSLHRELQVRTQIVHIFDADTQANQAVVHAAGFAHVLRDAGMGHRCRVADERLDAAQTLGEAEEFGAAQKAKGGRRTPVEPQRDHAAEALHLLRRDRVAGVVLQAGKVDLRDLGLFRQPVRE